MAELTVYRRFFRQSDCFRAGTKQTPRGVQVHSTGANNPWLRRYVQPDDGRLGVNAARNSHNRPGLSVCAHAYIGRQADGNVAVYQALPWEARCWLSGSGKKGNANRLGYVGFEICEDGKSDRAYLDAALRAAALLAAALCQAYALPVENVLDHAELHARGLASNHADIAHWLRPHGLDMAGFRQRVAAILADGVHVTYIDCEEVIPLYTARVTCPGAYLNLRAGPGQHFKTLSRLPRGARVSVLADGDDWWQVSCQNATGYALSREGEARYLTPAEDGHARLIGLLRQALALLEAEEGAP